VTARKPSKPKRSKRKTGKAVDPIRPCNDPIELIETLRAHARALRAHADAQRARFSMLERRIRREVYGIDKDLAWPKTRYASLKDRRIIEVYDITLEANKHLHKQAELIDQAAKKAYQDGNIGSQYFESTPESRFRGALGGLACITLVDDSWGRVYDYARFGEPDACDLSFRNLKFDAKSYYGHELQVNKCQFDSNKDKFFAYVSVYIRCDPKAKVNELIETCNTACILGYAKPNKIQRVFDKYKVGERDNDYGVLPGRNPKTGNLDDYNNPYCFIRHNKLDEIDNLLTIMTDEYKKGMPKPDRDESA